MTKEELFMWAADNMWEYPALDKLREEMIDGAEFLFLPGKYGLFRGLYLCFYEHSTIYKLRRAKYAVGVVSDYEMARELILECAAFIKKCHK